MRLLFIVTGYNCKQYVEQCYRAIVSQDYSDWLAVFISDGSTDGTSEKLIEVVKDPRCRIEINNQNSGAAKRRYDAIQKYGKKLDVVVLHGLDDYIFPGAMEAIAEQYNKGMWMSYGNWISQYNKMLPDGFLHFKPEIHANGSYRQDIYRSTGLNTFYKFVFDRIPPDDFLIDGRWIDSTTESEVMFSCLEMCGEKRIGIIEKAICLYRENLPNGSLNRLGREYKAQILAKVKARPKRNLIPDSDFPKEDRVKIVNLCTNDWTNFAFDISRSLNIAGVDCKSYICNNHGFNYPIQSPVIKHSEMADFCEDADIIQIFHSDISSLNSIKHLKKRTIVYHTGSGFRSEPDKLNEAFNPYIDFAFVALGELMNHGAKNEVYMVGSMNTDKIQPTDFQNEQIVFAHYPSKKEVKGTETIVRLMKEIGKRNRFVFNYNENKIRYNYNEQQQKMAQCHIYIELLKPELNGKKYGSFGMTGLEAAAMGKIVVTQNLSKEVYGKHYGSCPFVFVEDEKDFIKKINWLLSMSMSDIKRLQEKTRQWVVDKHSFLSTGNYLNDKLHKNRTK